MVEVWLLDVLKALGKFILHPVLFLSVLLAIMTGYFRVKRERRDFHTRLLDGYNDLRVLLSYGIAVGLVFSLITIGAGLVIPVFALTLIGALSVLFALTRNFHLVSAAITTGFSYFLLVTVHYFDLEIPFVHTYLEDLNLGLLSSVMVLAGVLTLIEGILIKLNGWKHTSPRLIKSERGLKVGVHKSKKLWLVPMFVLLPTGNLTLPFDWWPVFTLGTESYSLLCVPFLLGFQQLVKSTLPEVAIKQMGSHVFWLGAFILTLAVTGFWAPMFSVAAGVIAILGRAWLIYRHRSAEDSKPYYYKRQSKGVMILGILPGTPAEKLSLSIGEIILKVNGTDVNTERGFYEALQKNGAYCKLEVLGTNGENRFEQGALYEGDHHELGILFADQDSGWERHHVS
ncbi:PDZ serine protease [[Bacillus] enclensis]|uniref:PDZ domain-containing protein n=1 Tax=[Bacillus] enclensis TaxID=1402860 RepID=A0A0V8HBM2_9BACI|nr:PDZ domain-containing protein [[Bacillus] enclensis]KSU59866.1 PDZ serine protease [[Bacillus] enclensis]QTC40237.1 PDZ domain-containing protein [Bacillus sp. V3]QWC22358.1 PDZ domain-containing protein [Bacillus haikouensis]SCC28167.1 PDZ domain-containing protein [[Bacillus] enclensis]